ncbi:hypothetical protein ACWGQ5_48145 [Streptomyces sp. NPDC055722]
MPQTTPVSDLTSAERQVTAADADPYTVTELLLALPAFTDVGWPAIGREGFFQAWDLTGDDAVTRLHFPTSPASRVRTAIAHLRAHGYTTTAHAPEGEWGSTIDVRTGVLSPLAKNASAPTRAERLLWAAGFTHATARDTTHIPGYTTPEPVDWRPGWVHIDVLAPRIVGRDARAEAASAIADTFTKAGWSIDVRGTESLHTAPPPQAVAAPPTLVPQAVSLVIAGRPIGEYRPVRDYPGHFHSNDIIVGYVVRETIRGGKPLHHGEPDEHGHHEGCGYDVFAVDGAHRYTETFPTRDAYRQQCGGYAVVDTLYKCGCRS